jgi:hypothetical protein
MRAFAILDKDGSEVLDLDDIRQTYNAKKDPRVIRGDKTEDEVLQEFLDTFEQSYINMHNSTKDGKVTPAEWVEYYNNVSMSIDRDDYFELMMNNAWNFNNDRVTKRGAGF